ncbi:MAG TPA: hypothetical protein VGC93_11515 [Thermoanaerobaculia bacterium]
MVRSTSIRIAVPCLLLGWCLGGAAPACAQLRLAGPAMPIEANHALAAHPDGGFLVAYDFFDVFVRRYAPDGTPVGGRRQVNLAPGAQSPAIVRLASGSFLVIWVTGTCFFPPGDDTCAVVARLLDADGQPAGAEFAISGSEIPSWGRTVAPLLAGGFVAAWTTPDGVAGRRFTESGTPVGPEIDIHPAPPPGAYAAGIAPLSGGGFAVAVVRLLGGLFLHRFDPAGAPLGAAIHVSDDEINGLPFVAAGPHGEVTLVWSTIDLVDGFDPAYRVMARSFDASGQPRGGALRVDPPDPTLGAYDVFATGLATDPTGRSVVAWTRGIDAHPVVEPTPFVSLLAADGAAVSEPLVLAVGTGELGGGGSVAAVGAGEWVALWNTVTGDPVAQRLTAGCNAGPSRLCLNGGRYGVEVAWELPDGTSGAGRALPLADDSGAFWFFGPDNLELLVKVLDGRAVNGHIWVFYGAVTDVAFTLRVTDGETGAIRTYRNPRGTMASRADTTAFPALRSIPPPAVARFSASAQLHPAGPPVRLSEFGLPAALPDGGFLVVSADLGVTGDTGWPEPDLIVRRYDPAGAPGAAWPLNLRKERAQIPYGLAPLAGGGYVAVWPSDDLPTPAATAASATGEAEPGEISARLLDAEGVPTGPEILVNEEGEYAWEPSVAALTGGGFAVAWITDQGVFARRFDAGGDPLGAPILVQPRTPERRAFQDALAPLPRDGFVIAVRYFGSDIFAHRHDGTGAPLGPPLRLSSEALYGGLQVAADAAGGFVTVWTHSGRSPAGEPAQWVVARRVGPDGEPQGPVFEIARPPFANAIAVSLAMEPDGRFVVAWARHTSTPTSYEIDALVGRFAADGTPAGTPLELGGASPAFRSPGPIVSGRPGEWLATWAESGSEYAHTADGAYAQRLGAGCGGTAADLCLQEGRFLVEVAWELPGGAAGAGQAVPLTGDSGAFWFFGPDNLELLVKVLDGRPVNGRFWVFFGALSDVEYTLTVTDTATGAQRSYVNPAGTLASRADVEAF